MSLTFWKPGTAGPGSTLDRVSDNEAIVVSAPPQESRDRLPIYKHRAPAIFIRESSILILHIGQKLLYCVENYGVSIVVGQTGCGKTTQLPQFLYQSGWADNGHVIACTQPRRVAATSVAARVATEMGTTLGNEVGYTIRFEDVSNKDLTRILYLTDGMLFRELLVDPLLTRYSIIMVRHELSFNARSWLMILGSSTSPRIRKKRPELRLIVSSATMDADSFLDYFTRGDSSTKEAVIVSLEGRDILIFLPGREDIELCVAELAERIPSLPPSARRMELVPLYAGLTTEEQLRAFATTEHGKRKVVISTNIAEASVTIDGIRYVIDCGLVKIRVFNPITAVSSLVVVPASKASAAQRAGRAGRTSNGICYRLYTKAAYDALPSTTPPELSRTDLTSIVLQLKALGIDDLMRFEWISSPPSKTLLKAYDALCASGLITDGNHLTAIGSKIAECPLEYNIARMLFASKDFTCGEEILTIAAMISVQDVFIIPDGAPGALAELERRKFTAEEGVSRFNSVSGLELFLNLSL
ncbi:hypothetical protein MD484_g2751, partial [Candolleomyces efflorescens]